MHTGRNKKRNRQANIFISNMKKKERKIKRSKGKNDIGGKISKRFAISSQASKPLQSNQMGNGEER